MSTVVPLIRAAALVPILRWLHLNNRAAEPLLAKADLGFVEICDPYRPVPLLNAIRFLRELALAEGPDIACRVVSAGSLPELALIGRVALGARSPREAMTRVAVAMPYHCTHENITIASRGDDVVLRDSMTVRIDPEGLHLVHQYVAAIVVCLFAVSGTRENLLRRIEMAPHPEIGLDHLRPWFGKAIVPTTSGTLTMVIPAGLADRPFRTTARDRMAAPLPPGLAPLRGDGSLSASVRIVLSAMLEDGTPTVAKIVAASGLSQRTLQRRLTQENTSFSAILEDVRREEVLRKLSDSSDPLAHLSASLGFARQSALTRAVRRWTGRAPSSLREKAERNA